MREDIYNCQFDNFTIVASPDGRLGDIYYTYDIHFEEAIDCVEVQEWDWETGKPVPGTYDVVAALNDWVMDKWRSGERRQMA